MLILFLIDSYVRFLIVVNNSSDLNICEFLFQISNTIMLTRFADRILYTEKDMFDQFIPMTDVSSILYFQKLILRLINHWIAYQCKWPECLKKFSRHDNLSQHLRVHRVEGQTDEEFSNLVRKAFGDGEEDWGGVYYKLKSNVGYKLELCWGYF